MKILIRNANLIPMSENREKMISNIDILIENDKIVKIEKEIKEEANKQIDATRQDSITRINKCTYSFTNEHL